jgi:hypothetical protein
VEGISKGGGWGEYATADGDVPIAMHPNKGRDNINRVGDDAVVDDVGEAVVEDNAGWNAQAVSDLVVISWNCCGLTWGAEADIGSQLDDWGRWDIVLIQEGPVSTEAVHEVLDGGHLWYVAPKGDRFRSIAILVHRRWNSTEANPDFQAFTSRVAFLDILLGGQPTRFTSAHLPHSDDSPTEFDAALEAVENVIQSGRDSKRLNIVGIDANAILGMALDGDQRDIIGLHGHGERNDRGYVFANWLHGSRMSALGTMFRKLPRDLITHKLWSNGEARQIDYVLIDSITRGQAENIGTIPNLAGKSDHVPSLAVIKLLSGPKKRWKKEKKHIGWKTELDDDGCARTFHTRLNDELRNTPALDVEGVTRAIVAAASETAQITEARCGRRNSQEVQALFDERRAEENPYRRTKLSKDLWRALRRERRDKHALQLHEIAEKGGGLRHLCKLSREPQEGDRRHQL